MNSLVDEISPNVYFWNTAIKPKETKKGAKKSSPPLQFTSKISIIQQLFPLSQTDCCASTTHFQDNYFQICPVVSRGHNVDQLICDNFFNLDIVQLLTSTASENIHVWLSQHKSDESNGQKASGALESITVEDPEHAYKLYKAGHSIYCRAPAELEKIVIQRFSSELCYGIENVSHNDRFKRGEIEMFFSRKGHFTDFHCDFQENFTIQLSGKKKWLFRKSTARHPIRGCTPHFSQEGKANIDVSEQQLKVLRLGDPSFTFKQFQKEDMESEFNEVILNPGDVLYHPAGIWHRVECLEDSISMNISLTALSYADLFCSSLQQILLENPRWRSSVFPRSRDSTCSSSRTMQSIIDAMPLILSSLSSKDLLPYPTIHTIENSDHKASATTASESNEDDEDEEPMSDADEWESNASENETLNKGVILVIDDLELPESSLLKSAGKKKRKLEEQETDDVYYFNPLALLVDIDEDMKPVYSQSNKLASSVAQRRFIVTNSFGNETLEAAVRVEVVVHSQYLSAMEFVTSAYQNFRLARKLSFAQFNSNEDPTILTSGLKSEPISRLQIRRKASVDSDLDTKKLLLGLYRAGLLTKA